MCRKTFSVDAPTSTEGPVSTKTGSPGVSVLRSISGPSSGRYPAGIGSARPDIDHRAVGLPARADDRADGAGTVRCDAGPVVGDSRSKIDCAGRGIAAGRNVDPRLA